MIRITKYLIGWSVGLLALLLLGSALIPHTPKWAFDIAQRYKHPEYYAWRAGKGEFPKNFWAGFNTDTSRLDHFVGKSRSEIQMHFPLLRPLPTDDSNFTGYASYRNLPPGRFAWIEGSLWVLEFDEKDICVEMRLVKG